MKTMPKAVVFDLDGLLIDSERVYARAVFDSCTALGYPMTDALHKTLVGGPWTANRVRLLEAFGEAFPFEDYQQRAWALFEAACELGIDLRPGAVELIGFIAHHRIPAAVATMSSRVIATRNLERAGFLAHMKHVVSRDDVKLGKPDPECYLAAARHLGVDPAECLALEDSHNGARAALAAGMHTILVPDMMPATQELTAQVFHVAQDLHEVREMLEALLAPQGDQRIGEATA